MSLIRTPRAFLVDRYPQKLTTYERGAIKGHFGQFKPEFVRIELTDWNRHLDFCKKNVDKKDDIVVIGAVGAKEAQIGTAYWAIAHGYIHAIFGKDLKLRQLTGMTIKSKRLPKFR